MWDWIRKIPTPGYGKCGGASRDCSITPPRDWMDLVFEKHDNDLRAANEEPTLRERLDLQSDADYDLGMALRKGDPKKLGLWGKIYRLGAMMVFRRKQ